MMDPVRIDSSRRFVRVPGVLSTPFGDHLVLLSEELRYIGLDPTGQAVWQLLEQPRTIEELVDALVARFEVTPEQCRHDVVEFLADLERYGVVAAD